MDDLLEVETRVRALGAATVTLDQTVSRNGERLVSAAVAVVLVTISGKPLRLSGTVREAFEAYAENTKSSAP